MKINAKATSLASVESISQAKLRLNGVIDKTPLQLNDNLSLKYDCNLYLKREDMQTVRSFKIRGAYNKMALIPDMDRNKGVVCASAGNHAQGVAFASSKLEIPAKIFMPHTTPNQKISKVKHFGGSWVEVILQGDTYDQAEAAAYDEAKQSGATLVHPFNDKDIISGQGTLGAEILEECPVSPDYLFVAVGGGGLISGVGSYVKTLSPTTKIIGVEAEGAPAMYRSLELGRRTKLESIESFADGIAVQAVGELTFDIARQVMDDLLLVPEGKICSTILTLYNEEAIVAEPAGAVGIAALDLMKEDIKGKNVVVIVCGGNNDISRTQEIRDRALLWEGRKQYFIVRFPQRAGALREFLDVLGPTDDIVHFEYTKKSNRNNGPALVGIDLQHKEDFQALVDRMKDAGINYQHLNDNPMLFEMLV